MKSKKQIEEAVKAMQRIREEAKRIAQEEKRKDIERQIAAAA